MSDIVDRDELLERIDGDLEFLAETAAMYKEDYPRLLADIRTALARQESDTVAMAAHTLKGMASNFAAQPAAEAARAVEILGRDNDLSTAEPLVQRLEQEAHQLAAALDEILLEK